MRDFLFKWQFYLSIYLKPHIKPHIVRPGHVIRSSRLSPLFSIGKSLGTRLSCTTLAVTWRHSVLQDLSFVTHSELVIQVISFEDKKKKKQTVIKYIMCLTLGHETCTQTHTYLCPWTTTSPWPCMLIIQSNTRWNAKQLVKCGRTRLQASTLADPTSV